MLSWPDKDPQEVLDYQLTWTRRIVSDAISASSWARAGSDTALAIDSDDNTTSTATVWLSGGTLGVTYTLTNTVVTTGGRTMQQSVTLKIASK